MKHANSMKLIPALMLVAFSGAASASGFQLLEQNASGIANAYAGSAAVADNASTIYFNPAGMTQLQAREFSVGLSAVDPSFTFDNKGSLVGNPPTNTAGGLTGTGDGGNAGGWAFIPNGYLSWALSKDLYIGIGVGGPFGLKTEYDNQWVGAAQSTSFEIKTYNVNPSIAYRVNETVSLGLGVNWQYVDATYKRQAGAYNLPGLPLSNTPVKLTLDDDAWGWNVGALFTVSPSTKVGLSYRSTMQYHTSGKIQASGSKPDINAAGSSNAKADIKLPDTAIMSVTQKLSDKWEMLGDVSWTGWSSIPKVDILRSTNTLLYVPNANPKLTVGQPAGATAQTLDTDFRDTWRVALGANYQYTDAWKLKFGLAYDESPVKGASTRLTSLPDNDRVWFSFGAQWAPDKASRLDLGMSYIYVQDSKINNNQLKPQPPGPSRGQVIGDYSASIWLFGAQYSMAF